jgi:hypothetical protein
VLLLAERLFLYDPPLGIIDKEWVEVRILSIKSFAVSNASNRSWKEGTILQRSAGDSTNEAMTF